MSIVGRTGGKTGRNEDAAAFSEGFGWANFDSNSFFQKEDDAGASRASPLHSIVYREFFEVPQILDFALSLGALS